MTEEAMLTDYWSHYYYEKPEDEFEEGTDNFEDALAEMMGDDELPPDDDFEDISNG